MLQVILIQSGATEFDEQGRIKGTLDIPLSSTGALQVVRTCDELNSLPISIIYSAPGLCAMQTAEAVAHNRDIKVKQLDKLRNLDHGLWHGKLIGEVKSKQPKVFRQWQEHPETFCPPEGESFVDAQKRVRKAVQKILKKHEEVTIAVVVPEPVTSIVRAILQACEFSETWKMERDSGHWERIDISPETALV